MIGRVYGVDLGTSVIKIYKKGKGIICNQKNMIAVDKNKVLAIGDDAFEMYEKVPGYVHVTYPIKNGVIADIENMEKLFNTLLKNISKNGKVHSAEYVVAVPMDTTEVEKKAFIDLVDASRAKKVKVVAKPIAAAIGAGLDVCNAKGAMIVDMGASTTEIAVISLGGIVVSRLLPIGGDTFNDAIIAAVKKKYNLLIGRKTASRLKKALGNISKELDEDVVRIGNEDMSNDVDESIDEKLDTKSTSLAIYGRDVLTGLPGQVIIDKSLVVEAMSEGLDSIVEGIKVILERTPPEIASDIIDTGIYIVGGSATIQGIDELVREHTGLRVNVAANPENMVINGIGKIIETHDLAKVVCKIVK